MESYTPHPGPPSNTSDTQSYSTTLTIEKDSVANSRASRQRFAVQRALGFKNVVIYTLVFINLVLCSKLFSVLTTSTTASPSDHFAPSSVFLSGQGDKGEEGGGGEDASKPDFWIKMALIVFLVMIGGVFAGLTIGLMGLDETNLHVLMASGTPKEQRHAETVFGLLSRGKHWVLVTLLLGNVIVNETLPVVLDSELGGGIVAILISTLLIVIFGEIIPQAVCARYGLAIGSYCAKPMLVFMYIMSPVAYPIAMLLDACLGVHHGTTYRRTELKTLVTLHQMDGIGELTDDEVTIIASVLDLKEKPVSSVMTPLEDVFTLSEDAILDEELTQEIFSAGYSRIPIYRHDNVNNFIGMLLVKRLITYDPEDHIAVRQLTINSLPEAASNTSCLDILNFFQEGRSHMAIVTSKPGGMGVPIGVITLEDVIEELLGEEIVDESDVYVDIHNKVRVIRKPSAPSRNVSMIKSLKSLLQSPAMSDSTPLLGHKKSFQSGSGSGGVDGDVGGESTTPVDTKYKSMSTGKSILHSRKSSSNSVHRLSKKKGQDLVQEYPAPKVVTTVTDTQDNGNNNVSGNDMLAVDFKDTVQVIPDGDSKEVTIDLASDTTPDTGSVTAVTAETGTVAGGSGETAEALGVAPGEKVVVIDVPEPTGTYPINPTEETPDIKGEGDSTEDTTKAKGTLSESNSSTTVASDGVSSELPPASSPASASSKKNKKKKKKSNK